MTLQQSIHDKIIQAFAPKVLEVINESKFHNVPPGSESHFKVVLVSDFFKGLLPLARHRKLHDLLEHELKNGVHALTLQLHTVDEWKIKGGVVSDSPPCFGSEPPALKVP